MNSAPAIAAQPQSKALYDWDHVDAKTGQARVLQVDQALACIEFAQGTIGPVVPVVEEVKPVLRERLLSL
jgi:mannose-6-phosphate isomerase